MNFSNLISDSDLHNLKKTSIELEKYKKDILEPFKNTMAGEIRRYIIIHRKIEVVIREADKLITQIKTCLTEKNPS